MKNFMKNRPGIIVPVSTERTKKKTTAIQLVAESTRTKEKRVLKRRVRKSS